MTLIKNQQGVILILSVIMTSVLLSTALGFALFIFIDLRQARSADNSLVAYYAADAGIEKSLYLFRKAGISYVDGAENSLFDVLGREEHQLGGASWNIGDSTDYESNFIRQRLYSGQSVKLYFLKRAQGLNQTKSIGIKWYKGSTDSQFRATFIQLNPQLSIDGNLLYYTDQRPEPISRDSSDDREFCFDFLDENIFNCQDGCLNNYDYVVELESLCGSNEDLDLACLDSYIDSLAVVAYSENRCNGQPLIDGITNITINSIGQYGQSQRQLTAHILPRDPSSGLLDFVLFSEADIEKGY